MPQVEENPWEFSEAFFLLLPAIIFYTKSIIEGKQADDISYQEGKYQEEMTHAVEQRDTSLQQALGWDQRTAPAFGVGHRFPMRPEVNHISPVTHLCCRGSLQDKTERYLRGVQSTAKKAG